MWIRGLGRSMLPVLLQGDLLRVQRCAEAELELGDIAVTRQSGGPLVAHLVTAKRPLETRGFLSATPDLPAQVLARVVAVRRGRLLLPMGPGARAALWGLYRATVASKRVPLARTAFRIVRALWSRVRPN
jgi:hypothetical protein